MGPTSTHTHEPPRVAAGRSRTQSPPTFSPAGELQARSARRRTGRAAWAGVAAALAAAVGLLVVGLADNDLERANQAATARLQAEADAQEAVRVARSNWAATARLQAQADAYERARLARANRAATARLQAQADAYEAMRVARSNQAATARLQAQADRVRD